MRLCVGLIAVLVGCGSADADGPVVTRFTWTEQAETFGGFSGIEVLDGGSRFLAITDRGTLWSGSFARQSGTIFGVTNVGAVRLRDRDGAPLPEERDDAEGLAVGQDGRLYVSFEGPARVLAYPAPGTTPTRLPRPEVFRQMQRNSALESLAVDLQDRVLTLPERSGRETRPFPVYRFDGRGWSVAFELERRAPFLAVGLDVAPDGRIYLLERDFTGIGFRSRIRRFGPDGGAEETIWQSGNAQFDNLEGLSVWEDAEGRTRLTMISDDNFRFLQTTQIVELVLPD